MGVTSGVITRPQRSGLRREPSQAVLLQQKWTNFLVDAGFRVIHRPTLRCRGEVFCEEHFFGRLEHARLFDESPG